MKKPLLIKLADREDEFNRIHSLNYTTFVEEIPQHGTNQRRLLVDKFHSRNSYLIAKEGNDVVGMLSFCSQRPFSLDETMPDLDRYLPNNRTAEIRLLSIVKERRGRSLFSKLVFKLYEVMRSQQIDYLIVSGIESKLALYYNLGFKPFAQKVTKGGAVYQPMLLDLSLIDKRLERLNISKLSDSEINLLPGPVAIHPAVADAFAKAPVSHRGQGFLTDFNELKRKLKLLVNCRQVEICLGSGTLANEIIAAQIKGLRGKGLVLSNGEFGERLIDHAARQELAFEKYSAPWGKPFNLEELAKKLNSRKFNWLWFVHHETSTGLVNNLPKIKNLAKGQALAVCVDCISSIGALPLDLNDIDFASGSSGKAIGSYTGLSFVFYKKPASADKIPRYLDLNIYIANNGVPFSASSNLVSACNRALDLLLADRQKPEKIAAQTAFLAERLQQAGFQLLSPADDSAPAVLTIVLPNTISSTEVGNRLNRQGILVSYESDYLKKQNWLQIASFSLYPKGVLLNVVKRITVAAEDRLKSRIPD